MLNKSFLCLTILWPAVLFPQEKSFTGVINPDGGGSIVLHIKFSIDPYGQISGRTITDPFGSKKTISSITGYYSDDKIVFTEHMNVESKIKDKSVSFCYLQGVELGFKQNQFDIPIYQGEYLGKDEKGLPCSTGNIIVSELQPKQQLKEDRPSNNESPKNNTQIQQTDLARPEVVGESPKESDRAQRKRKLISSQHLFLSAENNETLSWESDSTKLYLNDSFEIDGDSVQIFINGVFQSEALLTNKKIKIEFESSCKPIEINIIAISEGKMSPNTAELMLVGKSQIYRNQTKLRMNERTTIILN